MPHFEKKRYITGDPEQQKGCLNVFFADSKRVRRRKEGGNGREKRHIKGAAPIEVRMKNLEIVSVRNSISAMKIETKKLINIPFVKK